MGLCSRNLNLEMGLAKNQGVLVRASTQRGDQMRRMSYLNRFVIWICYQCRMLKHRPGLIWDGLWIRKDEFYSSLNMNGLAMLDMDEGAKKKYISDLSKRRSIAHERDLRMKN